MSMLLTSSRVRKLDELMILPSLNSMCTTLRVLEEFRRSIQKLAAGNNVLDVQVGPSQIDLQKIYVNS